MATLFASNATNTIPTLAQTILPPLRRLVTRPIDEGRPVSERCQQGSLATNWRRQKINSRRQTIAGSPQSVKG